MDALVAIRRSAPELRDGGILGEVDFIEQPFGNVITNIPAETVETAGVLEGDQLSVRIGAFSIVLPFLHTFADVPAGKELALLSSRRRMSFSVNQGDFARRHDILAGQAVEIKKVAP